MCLLCCLSLLSFDIPWVSGETKLRVMISNILKQGWANSCLISSETVCCVRVFMSALADFHRAALKTFCLFFYPFSQLFMWKLCRTTCSQLHRSQGFLRLATQMLTDALATFNKNKAIHPHCSLFWIKHKCLCLFGLIYSLFTRQLFVHWIPK